MRASPFFDSPDSSDMVGQIAGEYQLKRKLGEGGFGTVYEAEHPLLKRRAAVKVLHKSAARNSDAVLRFVAEAQSVNQIHSPHIVDIFSFGKLSDGRHFYVMDLLDGEPLDRVLERESTLTVAATIQLLTPIAEALDSAHDAGIVHRDLKPQNIYLTWQANGEVVPKLLDFGLAKLLDHSPIHTASGTPLGTPLYMSPEQARGQKIDRRADVYALGVLCHELLTGSPPITGDSPMVVLLAHLTQTPPRASEVNTKLPPELDAPILRMLEKDAEARPASAGQALQELKQAAEQAGLIIPAAKPRLAPPLSSSGTLNTDPSDHDTRVEFGQPPGYNDWARVTMVRTTAGRGNRKGPGWLVLGASLLVAAGLTGLWLRFFRQTAPGPGAPHSASAITSGTIHSVVETARPKLALSVTASATPDPTELRVLGAPAGARVLLDGLDLGAAPGPVTVPQGSASVRLDVAAPGYATTSVNVVPNKPLSVTVQMKRRRGAQPSAARQGIPKDLESPF